MGVFAGDSGILQGRPAGGAGVAWLSQDMDELFARAWAGESGVFPPHGEPVNLSEGPSIRRYSSPSRTRFCAFFRSNFFGSNFPIHSRQCALSGCRGVERASIMLK